ncbi:hypothetical protein J3A83DRAFT_2417583 [Scleroderma citrinum]
MVASITAVFTPEKSAGVADNTDDDFVGLQQEWGESKGEQIYRYLKTVVAEHAAVDYLCTVPLPELLNNIEIGLIEVPRSPSSVLTRREITEEFFVRYPHMTEDRQDVVEALEAHYSDTFSDCVHAEATLMGLVNYYNHDLVHEIHSTGIKNQDMVRRIIQPVVDAEEAMITASKMCCWCCDWLGQHLTTHFVLPGTHGIMYPWDPPKFGVSVSVLRRLERELWRSLSSHLSPNINTRPHS